MQWPNKCLGWHRYYVRRWTRNPKPLTEQLALYFLFEAYRLGEIE